MSLPTLFVSGCGDREPGARIELDREEAAHVRALRLRQGDRFEVTDGRGTLWAARLEGTDGTGALCTLLERVEAPPAAPIDLAFGVARKDRTLWLVEKAVELGVRSLAPVEVARSRSVADGARSAGFWRKAERRAVAALKQCGGSRLPRIHPVRDLPEFLATLDPAPADRGEAPAEGPGPPGRRYLARVGADRTLLEAEAGRSRGGPSRLFVGPEGGLEEEEVEACLAAGFRPIRLGPRTLRFETAAVAGVAVLVQAWDGRGRAPETSGAGRPGPEGEPTGRSR